MPPAMPILVLAAEVVVLAAQLYPQVCMEVVSELFSPCLSPDGNPPLVQRGHLAGTD